MYRVKVEKLTIRKWTEKENKVVKRTPTQIQEKNYGGDLKAVMAEEYAIVEVEKQEVVTTTILLQEISDETTFDLKAVIQAVNGIK